MPIARRKEVQWSPGLIFVTLGLVVLIQAGLSVREAQAFLSRAVRAEGVVTEVNAGRSHPMVQFALPSGERQTFAEGGSISYKKGDHVRVLYLPEEPETSAHIDDPGALWFDAKLTATIGVAFCIAGCCALFLRMT
jgi:hypothetical protein